MSEEPIPISQYILKGYIICFVMLMFIALDVYRLKFDLFFCFKLLCLGIVLMGIKKLKKIV